jgi:hypothetical protein
VGSFKIFFVSTMKPEKLNFTWKLSDLERRQLSWLKSWPQWVRWGKWKLIFDIGKYFCMAQGFSGERCGSWVSCFYTKNGHHRQWVSF